MTWPRTLAQRMDQALLSCKTWVIISSNFPRELHDKFTREMIYVWEIDVGVIFNPGSGKSLLAFILENRRAVAFVKNKAHRDFIMDNLSHEVKA